MKLSFPREIESAQHGLVARIAVAAREVSLGPFELPAHRPVEQGRSLTGHAPVHDHLPHGACKLRIRHGDGGQLRERLGRRSRRRRATAGAGAHEGGQKQGRDVSHGARV
jgi:hypothetical protein